MNIFQEYIKPVYPPNNYTIFEEWLWSNYSKCNTDRELLPAFFTSFWVNHNYGNDKRMKQEMQEFIDSLDRSKKYFTVIQYDDGALIDFKDLDILQFNMSKKVGIEMPLLCQPHPYKFDTPKKYLVSFVGSRTHPMRNELEKFIGKEDWYISYESHNIEKYCQILHESIFVICPRGYGANSFRIAEALQYGAIPIYVSDEFIKPFDADFNEYGWLYGHNAASLDKYINILPDTFVVRRQMNIEQYYQDYYTYEGALKQIIKSLETEYTNRAKNGAAAVAV